ncbi:hypothetical protein ACFX2H_039343 [Malus domestica]
MPQNLVVKLTTMVPDFPIPSTSLVAMSSFMIIATKRCGVHFEGSSIHFWEWCRSSRSGIMVFHQELIVLFSYQEHRYQLVVFSVASRSILLLQEHVIGMKCAVSLFQQHFFSNGIPTELHLRGNPEQCKIVLCH